MSSTRISQIWPPKPPYTILMAAPGGKYFIQDNLKAVAPHHRSFKDLWETKWKLPASMGVYPFMFGAIKDFESVVDELVKKDMREPYDWDEYAQTFFPKAEKLVHAAEDAESVGHKEKASELYLRASAVYRIARFPLERSHWQKQAWSLGKDACLKGLSLCEHPVREVQIPHKHANAKEGASQPAYFLVPKHATKDNPVPLIIIFTGLDGHRTELATWMEGWRNMGCASLVIEIPGTGDAPADSSDPTSSDRQWSSMIDWIEMQPTVDPKRIIVWAFSTGGYYAIRLAHTHPDKFLGIAALGGGCHHMFDKEWLDEVDHLEYPFEELSSLAYKFGYGNDVKRFKEEAGKFSLLNDGTLQKPCGRLLLVNGTEDEIFPIDDYYLCLQYGDPKEARFVPKKKHMGEPDSFIIIISWIYKLLGIMADPAIQLKGLPFQPKY